MRTKALLLSICAISLANVGSRHSAAQAAPGIFSDANHPSGVPDPQKFDQVWSVDPINGEVSIKIPFPSTPEGGRCPKVPFALLYNSGSTVTLQANGAVGLGNGAQTTVFKWSAHPLAFIGSLTAPSGPWTTTGPYFNSGTSVVPDYYVPGPNGTQIFAGAGCTIYGPYTYVDQDGGSHDLNLLGFSSNYSNPSAWAPTCGSAYNQYSSYWPSSMTSDGSGMLTQGGGNGSAKTSDGTAASAGTLTDTNSNSVALATASGVTTATDALGRTVYVTNIPIGQPGQIPAGTYYVKTYGEAGSTETYTVIFSTYTLPSFTMSHPTTTEITSAAYCTTCNSSYTVNQPGGDTFTAVQEIDLPDSESKYEFSYDTAHYGSISQITFPTGGTVQFTWGIRDEDWSPYGQFQNISAVVVTSATLSDGSSEDTWTYAMKSRSNSSNPVASVTAPDSSRTDYTGACFVYGLVTFYTNQARPTCKEVSRAIYNSAGTLIKTVAQNFLPESQHFLPFQVATTLYDGQQNLQQLIQYNSYDQWDNVTSEFESDYNPCSGTPCAAPTQSTNLPSPGWLRETYTQYAYSATASLGSQSLLNSAFTAAHIINKPAEVTVTDGSGNAASLTDYQYNSAGNLTTETKCITITGTGSGATCGSSYWQTSYQPDTHGQVASKTEASNVPAVAATTQYTWTGPSGQSDLYNGYLTKITYPNGATDQYTYSSDTGQKLSHSDWNIKTTTYDYGDPLNRLTSVTSPSTTDGTTGNLGNGLTTYTFTDTPGAFAVQEQRTLNMNQVKTSNTTYFDGLGRKITTKTVTPDCTNPIEVDTAYDSMGRVHTASNPYCSMNDGTSGLTTYTYDALGRKIQIQAADGAITTFLYGGNATRITEPSHGVHIQQVNGLGQMTYVCEVTSYQFGNSGPSACPLSITGTGYLTSYFYDPLNDLASVNQHGLSRSFVYDSMSRLTQATNPETGSLSYVYSNPTTACSADAAVPCSRTDARGMKASYTYDSLSRLLSKTYNDSATPTTCYQYDAGTGTNPKGHLTNSWTQAASSGICNAPTSFITLKSFLNYDNVGRLLNGTQQSCAGGKCSGPSPYQLNMSYDLAGNLTTLQNPVGASGAQLTLTNYFDVASRPCLTTSSWTTPASANIFQVTPGTTSPGYSPGGGLQNYYLGSSISNASTSCGNSPSSPTNVALGYTKRFWVSSISATGQIP